MLGEKIDYERIRRLMHFDLQELHSDMFKIREEIRQIFRMQLVTYSIVRNEQYKRYSESREKERSKQKNKKNIDKALKTLEDLNAFDDFYNKMIKDAEKELRVAHKERMEDYKTKMD